MKIVSYNPEEVANIPAMMNEQIMDSSDNFIMFIFNNLLDQMIDKQKSCTMYQEFMLRYNLPFMMFPYYMHFNKILHGIVDKPNPRAVVRLKKTNEQFDIIGAAAYGMLIVNKSRLSDIEFKFDERYAKAFYIQDIMHQCFKKGIWMSSTYLIDIHESWRMFKNTNVGYGVPPQIFLNEKNEYMKNVKENSQQTINDFIGLLKTNYGG